MNRNAWLYATLPLSLFVVSCRGGANEDAAAAPEGDAVAAPSEEAATIDTQPVAGQAEGGPPAAFNQCKTCHSVEPGKAMLGPSLAGVYGGAAGETTDGFAFSSAMKESGLTWDDATLDSYLENPRALVPGTKMSFAGLKDPAQRREVIEYLKTLGSPAE